MLLKTNPMNLCLRLGCVYPKPSHTIVYIYIYPPETNIAPENGWLEDYFPFGMAYFQGAMLVLGRVIPSSRNHPKVQRQGGKGISI